jgi:hypothetical protein
MTLWTAALAYINTSQQAPVCNRVNEVAVRTLYPHHGDGDGDGDDDDSFLLNLTERNE